ncbi:WD-40 repeat protein [Reticulomyxa filosa]|uniref:WD-40 repeat protein n=1 Tax=Reticulomyxa filosa TaxID=46433 RepID=X6M1I5_RETFI|nr:WD-40 repeat protein [Reticulomyxa filosa]|eukprot:ETO07451.1 WD-40 repeat protein [Reticulomyxa filosa]
MNKAEDEKWKETEELVEIGLNQFSFGQQCFDKNWLLRSNTQEQISHFVCLICKQVANNPVEINCPQHEQMDEAFIVGENCLKQFFKNNNNICPVQSHDGCQYYKIRSMQRQINSLNAICQRQFEQDLKTIEEGLADGDMTAICNFKGKIEDISGHLINNSCALKISNCWFKQFGCEYSCFQKDLKQHLIENMKQHFELVIKKFELMRHIIQQQQSEIKHLKSEKELNEKKQNDNLILRQQSNTFTEIKQLKREIESKNEQTYSINSNNSGEEKKENYYNHQLLQSKFSSTFNFDLFRSSSKLVSTFTGHTGCVYSIDYSTFDGDQFVCSGSYDNTVRVWDIDNNKQIQLFNGRSSYVYCVKFSPYHCHSHHQNVICSSSLGKDIRFWDVKHTQQLQVFNGHTHGVCGIEFSQFNGGRYLCSGSYDDTIRLWDVETSKVLHVFKGHKYCVWCVDFSPLQSNNNDKNDNNKSNSIGVIGGNGYTICSGSFDKTICIWDIETTKQLIVFKEHGNIVRSVKYGPNDSGIIGGINTILSGSCDNTVRLWDIRSGHKFNTVEYSPFVIKNSSEVVGPNVICSGSDDNTIRFWDIRSNKNELYVIKGDEKEDCGIICLKFMPLKKKENNNEKKSNDREINLCYGSGKGSIRIWG